MRIFFYTYLLFLFLSGFLSGQTASVYTVQKHVQSTTQKNGEISHITFTVLKNNNKVYEIHSNVAYDIPFPQLKVFDNGHSVLIDAFNAHLTFYNNEGIENSQVSIMKDPDAEYERSVYSATSKNSIVIAINQPGLDFVLIQYYNYDGRFTRELKVNEKHLNGLEYAEKLGLIALSVYDWSQNVLKNKVLFINSGGEYTVQEDISFSEGDFVEEKGLFTGNSNNSCFILDLSANRVLFSKQVQKDKMILVTQWINSQLSVMEAGNPALKNGQWYFQSPSISFYNIDGDLINTNLIECKPFTKYHLYKNDSQWFFETENEAIPVKD